MAFEAKYVKCARRDAEEFGLLNGWPKFSSDDWIFIQWRQLYKTILLAFFYKLDDHPHVWTTQEKKAGKEDSEKQLCAAPGLPSVHEPERRHGSSRVPEPLFVKLLRCPGIDSQPGGLVRQPYVWYWLLKRLKIRALAMPSFRGVAHDGWLCTFTVLYNISWKFLQLAAFQLLSGQPVLHIWKR